LDQRECRLAVRRLAHNREAVLAEHAAQSGAEESVVVDYEDAGALLDWHQPVGVTRYASKTDSILRIRAMQARSASVSPTSTTKRFFTIGCTTVQRASRMLIPVSANVRERASSRRGRSQPSTWSSTRNDVVVSPSHDTGVKRSGFFMSAAAFGQCSLWIVMPFPREM